MLFGYQFPTVSAVAQSGPFSLVSANYLGLSDQRPGVKTLFTQNTAGTQTLTLTMTYGGNDVNAFAYPYLLVGVVNIGNAPYTVQLLPSVTFTPNGKWGASGANAKTVQAALGPTGYASAWAVIPRSAIVGSTATTSMIVALTGNFATGFGNFGIGEIVMIGCDELPLYSSGPTPTDPSLNNRPSGNVPWPVLRRAYRQFQGMMIPTSRADNVVAPVSPNFSRTLQAMVFAASQNGGAVIAPWWRNPGVTAADTATLLQNCFMARMLAPMPQLLASAPDSSNLFKSTWNFEEAL